VVRRPYLPALCMNSSGWMRSFNTGRSRSIPGRVKQYLEDLRTTLEKGGLRARQLLQSDIERINVHPVLDAVKPFRPLMLEFLITY